MGCFCCVRPVCGSRFDSAFSDHLVDQTVSLYEAGECAASTLNRCSASLDYEFGWGLLGGFECVCHARSLARCGAMHPQGPSSSSHPPGCLGPNAVAPNSPSDCVAAACIYPPLCRFSRCFRQCCIPDSLGGQDRVGGGPPRSHVAPMTARREQDTTAQMTPAYSPLG